MIIIFGIALIALAFYQIIFGGSDKPQDSSPTGTLYGGDGG